MQAFASRFRCAAALFGLVLMVQPTPPLRELAGTHNKWIGTAVNTDVLAADPQYAAVIADQFSILTPENVMKWQLVEPRRGRLDFAAADRLVAFAQANGQQVRGHTLVWHNQLPSWVTQANWSADELDALLQQHVTDEVSHFSGLIYAWDVINEPFNDDGSWRQSIWYTTLGSDYVVHALEAAHAADPQARLYINDYSIESVGPKSDALYALAQDLQARGVPLDGIGFQAHLSVRYPFPSSFEANLQRFADLGLDVAITEADVRVALPETDASLAQQAEYFGRLARACVNQPRCVSYTLWGFTDAHSWVPTVFSGEGAATPWNADLVPKPAFTAIRDALTQN